ncbi:hypothetical protein M9H77_25904 [Catharanthus roseus]|uniref:Uncharacterized protein n=1 Tax=Catharanthus roseus TaxID=4058 RepID=A0ACC0A951_CATRO|nr:hypothetical protein M9H77_25904 [Catharanthus roseus]
MQCPLPPQNAENLQQWLGREDKRPIGFQRPKAVVLPSFIVPPSTEFADTGNNVATPQRQVTRHHVTGSGLVSPGLRNQVSRSSSSLPPYGRHFATGVKVISPGSGSQISCSLGSLPPNQQQKFASYGGNFQIETLPTLAAKKSKPLISSASGSSHNAASRMVIDDLSGKDVQMTDAQTACVKEAEKQVSATETMPKKQQNDMPMMQNIDENARKRKKESTSSLVDSALDGKDEEMDMDIEAYFSQDDNINEMATLFSNLQQSSSASDTSEPEGFSFKEIGSLHSENNKLLSCHFSSSGKQLVAAGHEQKIILWNVEDFSLNTVSGHSDIITDVRFQPNSTVFGTCSFDKTVLIWDAYKGSKPLFELTGHTEHVMSLDFHPVKMDLLCSCDSGNNIRFWNVNNSSCSHVSEGAGARARFQSRMGKLLAAATGNSINLIDVETNNIICKLQGNTKDIRSFCWSSNGQYIAAVSEDSAQIWSIKTGEHSIHAFPSSGNAFESCTFHPAYFQLLVIGLNKSIQFWNPAARNKTWSYKAHEDVISALAESTYTNVIASASHDNWLRAWK